VNDTRSDELRRKELYQTVHGLLSDAAKRPGIARATEQNFSFRSSERGLRSPSRQWWETRRHKQHVDLRKDGAGAGRTTYRRRSPALTAFIKMGASSVEQKLSRKARLLLSLVGPEKYRYPIISRIARTRGSCRLVGGKVPRPHYRPPKRAVVAALGRLGMTALIPYNIELTDCECHTTSGWSGACTIMWLDCAGVPAAAQPGSRIASRAMSINADFFRSYRTERAHRSYWSRRNQEWHSECHSSCSSVQTSSSSRLRRRSERKSALMLIARLAIYCPG